MTDLSNFMDVNDDDEDDFIPDSLASFIADANKQLDAATLNFLDTDTTTAATPRHAQDMSAETMSTPVFQEDEEDRKLKHAVLNKLHPSIKPRNLANEAPATPPSKKKSVFADAFETPPNPEEEISLVREERKTGVREEELIPTLDDGIVSGEHTPTKPSDAAADDDVSLEHSLATIGEKLFADGKKAAPAVEKKEEVAEKKEEAVLPKVQKKSLPSRKSSSAFDSDEDDMPLDAQFAAMEQELFVGGRLKKDALSDGLKRAQEKHAPPPVMLQPAAPPPVTPPRPAPPPQPKSSSFFGSILSTFGVPATPERATPVNILQQSREQLAKRQQQHKSPARTAAKASLAKTIATQRQVAPSPTAAASPRTPIISPLPVAASKKPKVVARSTPSAKQAQSPASQFNYRPAAPQGSLFQSEPAKSAKSAQSPKAKPLFDDDLFTTDPPVASSPLPRTQPKMQSPQSTSQNVASPSPKVASPAQPRTQPKIQVANQTVTSPSPSPKVASPALPRKQPKMQSPKGASQTVTSPSPSPKVASTALPRTQPKMQSPKGTSQKVASPSPSPKVASPALPRTQPKMQSPKGTSQKVASPSPSSKALRPVSKANANSTPTARPSVKNSPRKVVPVPAPAAPRESPKMTRPSPKSSAASPSQPRTQPKMQSPKGQSTGRMQSPKVASPKVTSPQPSTKASRPAVKSPTPTAPSGPAKESPWKATMSAQSPRQPKPAHASSNGDAARARTSVQPKPKGQSNTSTPVSRQPAPCQAAPEAPKVASPEPKTPSAAPPTMSPAVPPPAVVAAAKSPISASAKPPTSNSKKVQTEKAIPPPEPVASPASGPPPQLEVKRTEPLNESVESPPLRVGQPPRSEVVDTVEVPPEPPKMQKEVAPVVQPDDSAFLPPKVDSKDDDDDAFLPNKTTVRVESKEAPKQPAQPKPRKPATRLKTSSAPPRVASLRPKTTSVSRPARPRPAVTRRAPPPPPRRPLSRVTTPLPPVRTRQPATPSRENEGNARKPPSPAAAADAMAKAKERVRLKKLAEKNRQKQVALAEKVPPPPRVSRAPRVRTVTLQSAQERTLGRIKKKQLEVEAKLKEEEEQRHKLAEKVRAYGAGKTVPRPPKLSTSKRLPPPTPPPPPPPRPPPRDRTKLTTPKPFKFHGRPPPPPPPRDNRSNVTMAESIDHFMRKELRTPMPKVTGKPKLTTPMPFHFHESKSHNAVEDQKKRRTTTFAEGLRDFDKHLREADPKPLIVRDELKPTVPKSPSFTPVHKRDKPKSAVEKENEIMEYYETHQFKARGIMTQSAHKSPMRTHQAAVPKKLTVPKPFKLSADARGATDRHKPEEQKVEMFHARPMPKFRGGSSEVKRRPLYCPPPAQPKVAPQVFSPQETEDLAEIQKQFHAREMPNFTAGSKLTSPPQKPFRSRLRSNPLKAPDQMVPLTIEVRGMEPFSSGGVAANQNSPIRSATTPKPFRLSFPPSNTRESRTPDDVEIKRQFKARHLPMSTFVQPASITSPSKSSVPSSILTANPPKLSTEQRCEQREAAMLASRINAELVSRERATVRQRKQEEIHKMEMAKAVLPSPTKLKAGSMAPFRLASDARHEAYQKNLQKRLDEEERDRKALAEVRARPMPHFKNVMVSPRGKPPSRQLRTPRQNGKESKDDVLEMGMPRHISHGDVNSAISDLLSVQDSNATVEA